MQIPDDVLGVLERAEAQPCGIRLTEQLSRELYVKVAKVLTGAGFRWDRKSGLHAHPHASAADALESMLATGTVLTSAEMGFFETKGDALMRLMDVARVSSDHRVLEPSAGEGAIVDAIVARGVEKLLAVEIDGARLHRFAGRMYCGAILEGDFLAIMPERLQPFDRVVMNPPFTTPGDRRADLTHVLHAIRFLAPRGRLAAIMSAGVQFRQDRRTREFHEAIAHLSPVWTLMPEGSFKASGTGVNTVILALDRA